MIDSLFVVHLLPTSHVHVHQHRTDDLLVLQLSSVFVDVPIDFDFHWHFSVFHSIDLFDDCIDLSMVELWISELEVILFELQDRSIHQVWLNRPFHWFELILVANVRYLRLRWPDRNLSKSIRSITYLPKRKQLDLVRSCWWQRERKQFTVPVGLQPGMGGNKRSRRFFNWIRSL